MKDRQRHHTRPRRSGVACPSPFVAAVTVLAAMMTKVIVVRPSRAFAQQALPCYAETTMMAAIPTKSFRTGGAIGRWNRRAVCMGSICVRRTGDRRPDSRLDASLESDTANDENDNIRTSTTKTPERSFQLRVQEVQQSLLLLVACLGVSLLVISWEDISMIHPMRQELSTPPLSASSLSLSTVSSPPFSSPSFPKRLVPWGVSTVRGMAFGRQQREAFSAAADLEADVYRTLPSYNEVMLQHRVDRIPQWQEGVIVRADVANSVRTVQRAVLRLQECKQLATNYDYDGLKASLGEPLFRSDLDGACYTLKRAAGFLSQDTRNEIGFDWGSCAWRHCGALADAQEALAELDHLIGVLEPFECLFCLDIVERSLRDILALTKEYQDTAVKLSDYQPIKRMSDVANDGDQLDGSDNDYLKALSFLRNTIF